MIGNSGPGYGGVMSDAAYRWALYMLGASDSPAIDAWDDAQWERTRGQAEA